MPKNEKAKHDTAAKHFRRRTLPADLSIRVNLIRPVPGLDTSAAIGAVIAVLAQSRQGVEA